MKHEVIAGRGVAASGESPLSATLSSGRVVDPQLSALMSHLRYCEGAASADFNGYVLSTALQPIYSFAHQEAADGLFQLSGTLRFYVINEHGDQTSRNLHADGTQHADPRLWPLSEPCGASWHHRSYFRRAITRPDEVQTTGPYLSLPDARMCLTLSTAVHVNGKLHVTCLDIAA